MHEKVLNIVNLRNATKTTMRHHLTPVRTASPRRTNVGEDVEKWEWPYTTTGL